MNLYVWAARWGVSLEAVVDLQREMGMEGTPGLIPLPSATQGEDYAMANVRLEASRKGLRVWRNNVGALADAEGRFVRYGLANESKAVNEKIKSGDLIGIRPVVVAAGHVGQIIGQFVSREVKAPGWRYADTPREKAQKKWAELITSFGGDAGFCTGEGSL